MLARAVRAGCPRVFAEEPAAVRFGVIANGISAWQNHPIDGFVFSEDALMRGITRSLQP